MDRVSPNLRWKRSFPLRPGFSRRKTRSSSAENSLSAPFLTYSERPAPPDRGRRADMKEHSDRSRSAEDNFRPEAVCWYGAAEELSCKTTRLSSDPSTHPSRYASSLSQE